MATRYKVRERTAVDDLLGSVTVAEPSRYAPASAYTAPSDYTAPTNYIAPTNYSAPSDYSGPSDYGAAPASRYTAARSDYAAPPKRKLINRTVVVMPPRRPNHGELIWVPGYEYTRYFEDAGFDFYFDHRAVLDFSYAAEAAYWTDDYAPHESLVKGLVVPDVTSALADNGDGSEESDLWPDAIRLGEILRRAFLDDPECMVDGLDVFDLSRIGGWAGRSPVQPEEILAAVANNPMTGLGAAALDYAVKAVPNQYGIAEAVAMAAALNAIDKEESEIWGGPQPLLQQHFFLHSDSLHPGTGRETDSHCTLYALFGEYVVVETEYHHDTSGYLLGGRELLYLEPYGVPQMPNFMTEE